jgi:hypothetical protein
LTPREEIERKTDPLWSIEIKQWNLSVYKDFDEEVIFEANLFVLVKLQQYTLVFVCLALGVYIMNKVSPLSFAVIPTSISQFFLVFNQ